MRSLILSLTFLLSSTLLHAQIDHDELTRNIRSTFEGSGIPGLAVAIISKDSILYEQGFGYADVETKRPYTTNTVLNIGSITKTFVGVAVMQMVEAGKLDLDADINTYLPFSVRNPRHPETPITLRHLVTHTSTIRDRASNYELRAYASEDDTKGNRKGLPLLSRIHFKRMLKNEKMPLGQFLRKTLSVEGEYYSRKNFYKAAPGTVEAYSNIGAALAAYIVDSAARMPFFMYVPLHILNPLDMRSSDWHFETFKPEQVATRYVGDVPIPGYWLITYPDGGLISSTKDLATYFQEIIKGDLGEGTLLSKQGYKLLLQNQYEIPPLSETVEAIEGRRGIFWDIYGKDGRGEIGHSGGDPGIRTLMYFDPEIGLGCILTSNCSGDKQSEPYFEIWQHLITHRNRIGAEKNNQRE